MPIGGGFQAHLRDAEGWFGRGVVQKVTAYPFGVFPDRPMGGRVPYNRAVYEFR